MTREDDNVEFVEPKIGADNAFAARRRYIRVTIDNWKELRTTHLCLTYVGAAIRRFCGFSNLIFIIHVSLCVSLYWVEGKSNQTTVFDVRQGGHLKFVYLCWQ